MGTAEHLSGLIYKSKRALPVVLALVVALWITAYSDARGPYYLAHNLDPDYCYLLNALNIINGRPPAHVDHPGTTLQCFEALILQLLHPACSPYDLTVMVLAKPEQYLRIISSTLITLFVASYIALGYSVYRRTQSAFAVFAVQAAPFLDPEIFLSATRVYPETLSLILANLLACVMLSMGEDSEAGSASYRRSIWLGLVGASLIVTKMLAAPIIAFLPIMLRNGRERIYFSVAVLFGGALFMLPIYSKLGAVIKWIGSNLFHAQRYGAGRSGVVDPATYFFNLRQGVTVHPSLIFLLSIAFSALLLVSFMAPPDSRGLHLRRAVAGLSLGFVVSILVVSKSPEPHYLILPVALSGLLFYLSVCLFELRFPAHGRTIRTTAACGLLLLAAVLQANIYKQYKTLKEQRELARQACDYVTGREKTATVAGAYAASSPTYALAFGNSFADYTYTFVLRGLYPHAYDYGIWGNGLSQFDIAYHSALGSPIVGDLFLQGTALNDEMATKAGALLQPRRAAFLVAQFGLEKIYLLKPGGN
jgi:hypothetical protein